MILLLETVLFFVMRQSYFKPQASSPHARVSLFRKYKILKPAKTETKPVPRYRIIQKFIFEGVNALSGWEEKVFKGKTLYEVVKESDASFLRAVSSASASGLYARVNIAPSPDLYLSWGWRARSFPKRGNPDKLADKSQDDFAARIYVVFPGSNFFNSNVIEYIWDENIVEKTVSSSPFSQRIKLFVIRSGKNKTNAGEWQEEERNIYEDYKSLYGKPPDRSIGAIAIMSDSDNTKTTSEADFRDVTFKIKEAANAETQANGKAGEGK